MSIRGLIWDDWNKNHIARHDVVQEEVAEVCLGNPLTSLTYANRIRIIGPTSKGRMLTIILASKDNNEYYPVTARPASRKERQHYTKGKGGETL